MDFWPIVQLAGYIVLVLWALTMFVFVPEKTFKTTTWFGTKFASILKPGVRIKLPFPIQMVDVSLSTKVLQLQVSAASMTIDNAQITISASVNYFPKEGQLYAAAYQLDNPIEQMKTHVDNYLRAQLKKSTVEQVFSSTVEFQDVIKHNLSEEFANYGYEIKNVLVSDPVLSRALAESYERKLIADQGQLAASAEGETLKIKMTTKAEADAAALNIKADAFKDFRRKIAEGNTEAINAFLTGLPDGSLNARSVLDFFSGLDEREAIRDAAAQGANVVFVTGGSHGKQETKSDIGALAAAFLSTIGKDQQASVPSEGNQTPATSAAPEKQA
jgi:regulator of protease activity HflC (stomatin/prohibitin superfamily)